MTEPERASVVAILADLILLQSREGLPVPAQLRATAANGIVGVTLDSHGDLIVWTNALDVTRYNVSHTYDDGHKIHSGTAHRLGWTMQLVAYEDAPVSLPAETLAELAQLVEPSAIVVDPLSDPVHAARVRGVFPGVVIERDGCPSCGGWSSHCGCRPAASEGRDWLVWSNEQNAWWGPNGGRYVADIADAGRYTEEGAKAACRMRTWPAGKVPPEVAVFAPPSVLAGPDAAELLAKVVRAETGRLMAEREAPPAKADGRVWLVWSHEHKAWWKPARRGYAENVLHAGLYTRAQADDICSSLTAVEGGGPSEVAVRAPASLHAGGHVDVRGLELLVVAETERRRNQPTESDRLRDSVTAGPAGLAGDATSRARVADATSGGER